LRSGGIGFPKVKPMSSVRAEMTEVRRLLLAQSERGTIVGTVKDTTAAVIPAARVAVTHTQTGFAITMSSSDSGDYTVPLTGTNTGSATEAALLALDLEPQNRQRDERGE
jgi:hypothetical protein